MKPIWTVIITIIITAGLVGGGGYYYLNNKTTNEKAELQSQIDELNKQVEALKEDFATPTTTSSTSDETDDWTLFDNTEYDYSFKYPSDQNLTVSSDGLGDVAKKAVDIILGKDLGESTYKVIMTLRNIISGEYTAGNNEIIDLSLAEFATEFHNTNVNDTNPNVEGKVTGELKQTTINGMEAYTFTVTESFATPWSEEVVNEKSTVVLLSSKIGKVVIHYPTSNTTVPKILNTLKVAE